MTITIERFYAKATQSSPPKAVEVSRGSETILLVEDEEDIRRLFYNVLQSFGYRVLEAANGNEALHLFQEHEGENIHLLLTDVVMPQMEGKELAARIKIIRPKIKILFISGCVDNDILHQGILEPDIAFLQKPFTAFTLAQKVREVLDRT